MAWFIFILCLIATVWVGKLEYVRQRKKSYGRDGGSHIVVMCAGFILSIVIAFIWQIALPCIAICAAVYYGYKKFFLPWAEKSH